MRVNTRYINTTTDTSSVGLLLLLLRSKYRTQVQQQRPESPTVTLTWHACKYKVHKHHHRYILCGFFVVVVVVVGGVFCRLALWTRKVLCGSFLCAIYKFSFIHSFLFYFLLLLLLLVLGNKLKQKTSTRLSYLLPLTVITAQLHTCVCILNKDLFKYNAFTKIQHINDSVFYFPEDCDGSALLVFFRCIKSVGRDSQFSYSAFCSYYFFSLLCLCVCVCIHGERGGGGHMCTTLHTERLFL